MNDTPRNIARIDQIATRLAAIIGEHDDRTLLEHVRALLHTVTWLIDTDPEAKQHTCDVLTATYMLKIIAVTLATIQGRTDSQIEL